MTNFFSTATYPASSSLSNCAPRLPSVELVLARSQVNSASSTVESRLSRASRSLPWITGLSSGNSIAGSETGSGMGRTGCSFSRLPLPGLGDHPVGSEDDLAKEDSYKEDNQ